VAAGKRSCRSQSTFYVMLDRMPERNDCHREHVLRSPVMGAVLMRNLALPGYASVLTPTFSQTSQNTSLATVAAAFRFRWS